MSPIVPVSYIFPRANNALKENPPTGADSHITTHGSDWLWAVFAVFLLVDIILFAWCLKKRPGTRFMTQLGIIILTIGAWDYFAQASNLGWTTTRTEFGNYSPKGTLRQIFWVRYVDWILTAPLIVIMIAYMAGVHGRDMALPAFGASTIWVGWLVGALIASSYKWGYFVFAIVMGMFAVWYALFSPLRRSASALGGKYSGLHLSNGGFFAFMMVMYAIAWGCCEGGNRVSNTSEAIWYGILDLLMKPVWILYFLWRTHDTDYGLLRQSRNRHLTDGGFDNAPHHDRHHDVEAAGVGAGAGALATHHHDEKRGHRKFFGRKGAHDDVRHGVNEPAPRVSNSTMVDDNVHHGDIGHHGGIGHQGDIGQPPLAHTAEPGLTQPGLTQPGMTQPGMTQGGMTHGGMTQPGMTQAPLTDAPRV